MAIADDMEQLSGYGFAAMRRRQTRPSDVAQYLHAVLVRILDSAAKERASSVPTDVRGSLRLQVKDIIRRGEVSSQLTDPFGRNRCVYLRDGFVETDGSRVPIHVMAPRERFDAASRRFRTRGVPLHTDFLRFIAPQLPALPETISPAMDASTVNKIRRLMDDDAIQVLSLQVSRSDILALANVAVAEGPFLWATLGFSSADDSSAWMSLDFRTRGRLRCSVCIGNLQLAERLV